ncbi:hypothetical protein Micbo1qcDRAFT_166047 [Microdochium bolleyi]|uniref:J domain-containing protein n=1 Tax=Microdochium bolleyi TaxID=196109 RepID=A0A136IW58_9PEZI|nr:hypothetical protein Micbo1qcDRAFT_166047 [Microdochium bolleyi]
MHTTLLPRGRQAATRICHACRHQRPVSTAAGPPVQARSSLVATIPRQQPSPTTRATTTTTSLAQHAHRFLSTSSPRAHPPPAASSSSAAAAQATQQTNPTSENSTQSPPPPPPPESHYSFFPLTLPSGPPPAGPFAIDTRALRREFLQLQAKAHPDLHPPHLKARAEALSARINEAYKTLCSPLLRAQYLLDAHFAGSGSGGTHPASDEAASVEDPELLMQVLEAREIIEDAESEAELQGIKRENDERIRDSEECLGVYFAGGDMESAKHECVKLRYWVNIAETLHHWERGKPVVLEH